MVTIVCPQCRYGLQGDDAHDEQACPRTECGHRSEALIRAVHGTKWWRAVFE